MAHAQPLLKNPGFEQVGANGIPTGWSRELNEKLTTPLVMTRDAYHGKQAVCLQTEEWNFLRPQFITQEVALPPAAGACRLSAWCKGQGLIALVFQFRKDGKPLKIDTVNMGFGPTSAPNEVRNTFGLEQDYQRYDSATAVPAGADSVLIKIGNSVDAFDRLNIWGTLYLDDVELTIVAPDTIAPPAPSVALTENVTAQAGQLDVAPYARITAEPVAFDTGRLVDGDTATSLAYAGGLERDGNVNFFFPKPLALNAIQLYLLGNVSAFTVRGDADGDGRYEALLARTQGLQGRGWATLPLRNALKVKAVRVQAIAGNGLFGFRATAPFVSEVKLLAPRQAVALPEWQAWADVAPRTAPAANVPELILRPTNFQLPPAQHKFRKMVCADLWMWGVTAQKKDAPLTDLQQNPTFRKTVQGVKALGVDTVLVDLTNSSVWNVMPWPSKVANGTNENHLKNLITALHGEGLQVVVELIHNITPFETTKWHYPQEDTSRYPGMTQFPSTAHGTYFRDNWLTILDEIMACGADGVGLSSDESYYRPAFMETLPADDPGRKLYKDRFGYDVPAQEEDSLRFRQWIILRDEGITGVYGYIARQLRGKYPTIYLNTMWMVPTTGSSNIVENAIPWDMVAQQADITELGSDYMGPYGVRMAAAVNGWRKGTMLYNGDMSPYPPLPDIHFYGTTLWSVMYGCGSIDYWRYNYVADYGHAPALTRAYAMVDDLDALGAWAARPPKHLVLLSSRTSLDWWQVNAWWGKHNARWDRGLEGQRGWFADEATFNILQRNGYPFDWHYLDRLDQLNDLQEATVLVMPFCYSISDAAAEKVKAAVTAGARLILLDGRQGETDEWGEPRAVPAFKDLVDSGKAILVKDDILLQGASDRYANQLTGLIDKTLGTNNPLMLRRYGQPIDATLIEKNDTERFVFVLNWQTTPAPIDLGISLPAGRYQLVARDENQWLQGTLNGRTELTADDLRQFRLTMGAQKPLVLYLSAIK